MSRLREYIKFTLLNKYSFSIIVAFIGATFSMSYHTANISYGNIFQVLPLIVIAVYCCEKFAPLVKLTERTLTRSEVFTRDLFLLNFSFLLACLLSLVFSYNNSDIKGWWLLIVYFITLYGLVFSTLFAAIALLMKNHKIYTMVFSFLIIFLVSLGIFFPQYMSIPLLGNIETFFLVTGGLLVFHYFIVIGFKIARFFSA